MEMSTLVRTDKEIDELIDECGGHGSSKYPGMTHSKYPGLTYEQGIRAAIAWITNSNEESPMG